MGWSATGCCTGPGHLADATDSDLDRLVELGVRTIVDLRTDHDIAAEGEDRVPDGIAHVRVPIADEAGRGKEIRDLVTGQDVDALRGAFGDGRSLALATAGAANFVRSEAHVASFVDASKIVLDPDAWPVVWHCSAGKDRAGWVGTIALLAAGADDDAMVSHYLESNASAPDLTEAIPDAELRELLGPFMAGS